MWSKAKLDNGNFFAIGLMVSWACMAAFVLVTNFVYLTTVLSGGTITSASEMTLRLIFESSLAIQIVAIAGMPVNANYLPYLKRIFDGMYLTLFDFRGQAYPQCTEIYEPFAFETAGMFTVFVFYILFCVLNMKQVSRAISAIKMC